jgi:hypothetical protein
MRVEIDPNNCGLIVEGMNVPLHALPGLVNMLCKPDPNRWYRFERKNNQLTIHVRMTQELQEVPHGQGSGTDTRREGVEAIDPRNAHQPDRQQEISGEARTEGQAGKPAD